MALLTLPRKSWDCRLVLRHPVHVVPGLVRAFLRVKQAFCLPTTTFPIPLGTRDIPTLPVFTPPPILCSDQVRAGLEYRGAIRCGTAFWILSGSSP